jgi:hypothetical protein
MMLMNRVLCSCLAGLLIAVTTPAIMAAERPLLMEGKKTLYQRVLAKPGAMISAAAGEAGSQTTTPFTVYYVYMRKDVDGKPWVQVGADSFGTVSGWIEGAQLIPWNQTLTVSFRDPGQGNRVLLFKDKESLKSLIESSDASRYKETYLAAINDQLPEESPVVAIQPAEAIDITRDFYLVPIIDHEDVYLGSEAATMLEVTSVPLAAAAGEEEASATKALRLPAEEETPDKADASVTNDADVARAAAAAQQREQAMAAALRNYKSGLVFVIDATKSMEPYIDRTRKAVRDIYDKLEKEGVTSGMSFGVVAYRDAPEAVKALEYRVRTIADLKPVEDADAFFSQVDQLSAATASSKDFVEDAYAGVKAALDDIDWQGRDARYVILITDAGARGAGDPLSSTKLDAARLNRLAQEKGVVLSVLHLLTPAGADNHASAATQYRALSVYPGVGSLYHGVPSGDLGAFGEAVDALSTQISGQVHDVVAAQVDSNLPSPEPAEEVTKVEEPPAEEIAPVAEEQPSTEDSLEALQAKFRKLGYALRMQYLQKQQDGKVPEVFNAWLVDRDFINPEYQTLDVRVLLTRDQLSDLHDLMRQVIDTFEEGLISPQGFLENIRHLAATLSRNPEKLAAGSSLSELGFMEEYIEDLPYRSESMGLTLEDWAEWPAKRQIEYINRLEDKIAYYKALHDHTDLWVSLDGGVVSGQSVFPVELQMLP